MRIPSREVRSPKSEVRRGEWAAHSGKLPRSVFGNYRSEDQPIVAEEAGISSRKQAASRAATAVEGAGLQATIDTAIGRSFLYGFLAKAYEDPSEQGWGMLTAEDRRQSFRVAVRVLAPSAPGLKERAEAFQEQLNPEAFEGFLASYVTAFGHAARGNCPLNEIEYGDIKADPLFQPHRLADLAAFYRAFGLEVAGDAGERHDHICLELEFMSVLTAKEAYALEHQLDAEALSVCRDAQKRFLREHLGRWTPAFTRRLARMTEITVLGALAHFTRLFIEAECARCGVAPGSEDLLLRPVDEAAESLCASCAATEPLHGPRPRSM
jgi:putative dimethyl sulfoxide reductase chaperone